MGILSLFKSKKPPPALDVFDATAGGLAIVSGQRLVDPFLILNAQRFYVGLRREEKLPLYYSVYHSQPLAAAAVNVLVKMCNSRPVFKSGNPQVDARCKEIWRQIQGHQQNAELMRQGLIYGYSVGEWVSDDMRQMSRVVVPDSPMVRFVADQYGHISHVQQLAGTIYAPLDPRGRVPASKFILYRRDSESTFDYYGGSLFECALEQLENLCQIMRAQIAVYNRLGKPRFLITVDSTGISPEQFQHRIELAKAAFDRLSTGDATDLYMPAGCEVKIIGAESFGQRFADETRLIIQNYLAAVGIPAPLLNVVTQPSSGAEAFVRQQIISLQAMLSNIQDGVADAWNQSFWPIVARMEGFPILPVMEFESPRLLEWMQEEQGRQLQFANDLAEVKYGIRPPEWLAQQCGASEAYDLATMTKMIEQDSAPPEPKSTPATNSNARTKDTDHRATNNNT